MRKAVVLLSSMAILSGCTTFTGTQQEAFRIVKNYCTSIPDVDRDMGVRFEIVKKDKRNKERRISIECRGGQTR